MEASTLTDCLDWPWSLRDSTSSSCPLALWLHTVLSHLAFYKDTGSLELRFLSCMASSLQTEPFPQPYCTLMTFR